MQDYNSIINNMNRKIFFKLNKIKIVPDEEKGSQTVEEFTSSGFGFSQHYGGEYSTSSDVPNVSSRDSAYVTHRPHAIIPDHIVKGRKEKECPDDDPSCHEEEEEDEHFVDLTPEDDELREQGEESDVPPPESVPDTTPEEAPDTGAEPDVGGGEDFGGDPGMGDQGFGGPGMGDPNAGIPGQEGPKDPTELGRTYEMKKIYARLVSMNEYLSDEMSPKILKAKRSIAKAIDLFAVIGANPESYKDRIDEIIISYYKFLEAAYKQVRSFYKSEAKKVGGLPIEDNEEQNGKNGTEVKV